MPWALGMWTDRPWFQSTVSLVFGSLGDKVPQDFIDDRTKLRGAQFDVAAMKAAIPQMRDQFRANADWIEAQLGDGREFLLGEFSLADINAYMNVWYTRQSLPEITDILKHLPLISAWEKRIQAFGHGTRSEISTAEALEIGTKSTPQAKPSADPERPERPQAGRCRLGPFRRRLEDRHSRRDRLAVGAAYCDQAEGRTRGRGGCPFPPRGIHDHLMFVTACSVRAGRPPSSAPRPDRRRSAGGGRPGTFRRAGSSARCRSRRASGSPGR